MMSVIEGKADLLMSIRTPEFDSTTTSEPEIVTIAGATGSLPMKQNLPLPHHFGWTLLGVANLLAGIDVDKDCH